MRICFLICYVAVLLSGCNRGDSRLSGKEKAPIKLYESDSLVISYEISNHYKKVSESPLTFVEECSSDVYCRNITFYSNRMHSDSLSNVNYLKSLFVASYGNSVTVLSDTFDVNIEKKLVDRSISFVFGYEKDTLIGFLYLRNVGETIFAMEIVDMLKNEVNLSLEIADLVNETENLNVQGQIKIPSDSLR